MFEYKHIVPFDQSYGDAPGPMVLFSTPGLCQAREFDKVINV